MLMFAHGFNIHFNQVVPPADVDVSMIAPKAPGHVMRDLFTAGPGRAGAWSPSTRTSRARRGTSRSPTARASAARAPGVIETTFKEETETDLFGEQTVLCGGVVAPDQGGLRDAGRGGLPARGRLLRVHARDEADRRPVLPGRPRLHALLGVRHRGVRRLHAAARAIINDRDQGRDEEDPGRDPVRPVRPRVGAGEPGQPRGLPRHAAGARPSTRSRRWASGCAR